MDNLKEDMFYICTNKNNLFGANTILYKNLLSKFSERMNTETIYLIPSSVHEMLLFPYTEMDTENLNELLKLVNSNTQCYFSSILTISSSARMTADYSSVFAFFLKVILYSSVNL